MPLCDHMRPCRLHGVNRPSEVHTPILIEIVKGGVLERLASADASVVHEKVDSPEILDGHRNQVSTALGVETSLLFAAASPPRERMRPATFSAIVESFPNPDTLVPRSFTTTRAPRSARSSTYARPNPRPAPVTTATFPSNEIRSVIAPSSRISYQGRGRFIARPWFAEAAILAL